MRLPLCVAALVGLVAIQASAAPITSLPDGSIVPMPALNLNTGGPQVFSGITWTSTNSNAVFGWTFGYGFGGNGNWTGSLGPMAGTNLSTASMTFTFASPVTGVGGFLNFSPALGSASITIYDSANNVLESTVLSFTTGGVNNTGQFHGFLMNSAVISSFTLQGAAIGITNLTVDTTSTTAPEPGTLLLLGTGVGMIVARRRSKKRT